MDVPSPATLVVATSIMMIGSAIQAALGIGLALVAVPALVLLEPKFVPGPMLLASIVLAVATAWRDRSAIARGELWRSLVGLAAGTVIGAFAFSRIGAPHLARVFGVLILVAVGVSVCGVAVRRTPSILVVAGMAAGIMGTMVGIHGPPIALVFQDAGPRRIRATLGAFFAVGYAASVTALAWTGGFGRRELALTVALFPGVVIGWRLARSVERLLDPARTRWAVLAFAAVTAVLLLVR